MSKRSLLLAVIVWLTTIGVTYGLLDNLICGVLATLDLILVTQITGTCEVSRVITIGSGGGINLASGAKIIIKEGGALLSSSLLNLSPSSGQWQGIEIQTLTGGVACTLNNIRITGATTGITLTGASGLVLTNAQITAGVAISTTGASVSIQSSIISATTTFLNVNPSTLSVLNVSLKKNQVTQPSGGLIKISNLRDSVIELLDNNFQGVLNAEINVTDSATTIRGNTISSNLAGVPAFKLFLTGQSQGSTLSFSSNIFTTVTASNALQIVSTTANSLSVFNNTFTDMNVGSLISVQNAGTTEINKNTINGLVSATGQILSFGSTGTIDVVDNLFNGVTGSGYLLASTGAALSIVDNTFQALGVGLLESTSVSSIERNKIIAVSTSTSPLLKLSVVSPLSIVDNLFSNLDAITGFSIVAPSLSISENQFKDMHIANFMQLNSTTVSFGNNVWKNITTSSDLLKIYAQTLTVFSEVFEQITGLSNALIAGADSSNIDLTNSIFTGVTGFDTILALNSDISASLNLLNCSITAATKLCIAQNVVLHLTESLLVNSSGLVLSGNSIATITDSVFQGLTPLEIVTSGLANLTSNVFSQSLSVDTLATVYVVGNNFLSTTPLTHAISLESTGGSVQITGNNMEDLVFSDSILKLNLNTAGIIDISGNIIVNNTISSGVVLEVLGASASVKFSMNSIQNLPQIRNLISWAENITVDASYNFWGFTDESLFDSFQPGLYSPYLAEPLIDNLVSKIRYITNTTSSLINLVAGSVCNGILSEVPGVCGGRGACNNGTCDCLLGFTGVACDILTCINDAVVDVVSACSGHGSCLGSICNCDGNYTGLLCDIFSCPSGCSGHGECIAADVCLCHSGYTGFTCNIPLVESSLPLESSPVDVVHSSIPIYSSPSIFVESAESSESVDFSVSGSDGISETIASPISETTVEPVQSSTEVSCLCNSRQVCVADMCVCILGFSESDCSSGVLSLEGTVARVCSDATLSVSLTANESEDLTNAASYVWTIISDNVTPSLASLLSTASGEEVVIPYEELPLHQVIEIQVEAIYYNERVYTNLTISTLVDVPAVVIQAPQEPVPRSSIALRTSSIPLADCAVAVAPVWTMEGDNSTQWSGESITVQREQLPADGGMLHFWLNALYTFNSSRQVLVPIKSVGVEVKARDPVLVIDGAISRCVVSGDITVVSLAKSSDPEGTTADTWTLSVSCDHENDGCNSIAVVQNALQLNITAYASGDYSFAIKLKSGKRSVTKNIFLQVLTANTSPLISIISSDSSEYVNRQNKITLFALAQQAPKRIEWLWSAFELVGNALVSVPEIFSTRSLRLERTAIKSNALKPGSSYRIVLVANFEGMTNRSVVQVALKTSMLPLNGLFDVSPVQGTALLTNFQLTARNWDTPGDTQPLTYIYQYVDEEVNQVKDLLTTSLPSVSLNLPSGFGPSNNLRIIARARNGYGEETAQYFNVTVSTQYSSEVLEQRLIALQLENADVLPALQRLTVLAACLQSNSSISSSILEFISELIANQDDKLEYDGVSSAFGVLEILTRFADTTNDTSNQMYLDITEKLLFKGFRSSDSNTLQQVAATMSRIFDNSNTYATDQSINAVAKLAGVILGQALASEDPVLVRSDAFTMNLQKSTSTDAQNLKLQVAEQEVTLAPSTTLDTYIDTALSIRAISFTGQNPYSWSSSSENMTSSVLEFTVLDDNGMKIPVDAVSMKFAVDVGLSVGGEPECKYWSETRQTWDTFGCRVVEFDVQSVTCFCNHTTSFASFVHYDKSMITYDPTHIGASMTVLVVNSIYLICCVILFIFACAVYNKQPMRSRFLTPHIGLIAIGIDCALQGIVRSSLLLIKDTPVKTLNILSDVIIVIVSTLNLLALFVFAWQLLRYVLLRHTYMIMKTTSKAKLMLFRVMTSKILYLVAASIFAFTCAAGYLALVLSTDNSINRFVDARVATSVPAASYLGISVIIAIVITVIYIVDIVYYGLTIKHKTIFGARNSNPSIKNNLPKRDQWYYYAPDYFTLKDPLHFRIDAAWMIAALLAMCTSYGFGLNLTFDTSSTTKVALQTAFDLLFTGLKIMAFAGSTSVFTIRYLMFKKTTIDLQENDKEDASFVIVDTLRDPVGYKLMEAYTIQEMSLENVIFWTYLHALQTDIITMSPEDRLKYLQDMDEKFIGVGQYEVNLDSKTKREFKALLTKGSNMTIEEAQRTVYCLYKACLTNLSDTFSRFSHTAVYKSYATAIRLNKELTELGMSSTSSNSSSHLLQ